MPGKPGRGGCSGCCRPRCAMRPGCGMTCAATCWSTSPTPNVHGLRHSFAVGTLLRWYRDGDDVQARLPLLSTYPGHIRPSSTYRYLTACPELLALAAERLEAID